VLVVIRLVRQAQLDEAVRLLLPRGREAVMVGLHDLRVADVVQGNTFLHRVKLSWAERVPDERGIDCSVQVILDDAPQILGGLAVDLDEVEDDPEVHNPRNLLERMRDHDPTGEIHSTPTRKPDSLIQISQRRTLHSGGPPRTTRKHPLRHRNHRDRIRRSALIGQPRP
jgi:hypothetical protein